MTTYWFRPKQYGYGATPVTWQGWAVTVACVLVVIAASLLPHTFGRGNPWIWLATAVIDAASIAAIWVISRRKTDGEWRWRWGG